MMRPGSKSISSSDLDKGVPLSGQVLPTNGAKKAVFLDRDGTINVEKGYITDPQEIELVPLAGASISSLNRQGIPVIVITNQAAIEKRLLTVETFEKINEKLWNDLQASNAHYDALYYCPHSPEITTDCLCRKPKSGLFLEAAGDFNIDLPASFMIGDKLTDVKAGRLSGCKTVLLMNRPGIKPGTLQFEDGLPSPDFICDTLSQAIDWILPQILDNNSR